MPRPRTDWTDTFVGHFHVKRLMRIENHGTHTVSFWLRECLLCGEPGWIRGCNLITARKREASGGAKIACRGCREKSE